MKILYVTSTYKPSINGVAISVEKFYEELKARGHEVTILAPSAWGHKSDVNDSEDVIRYPSTPNPVIDDYPIPLVPLSIEHFEQLRSKEFDIVHAQHPYYVGFFAEMYADRSNAPFVLTHHTRYSEYSEIYFKNFPRQVAKIIGETSVDETFAKGSLVIAPSNAIKNELKGKMPFLNVEKLPTGISPLPRSDMKKASLRRDIDLPEDKTILISLSRLAKEKNIELLIDAIVVLPEKFYLQIVGGGPHTSSLIKYAKTNGVEGRVRFVGQVKHEEVNKYYEASDIFVMASTSETQGITLLESQYYGLPCVAVDCEVTREWISPEFGSLTENNPLAFAEGVEEVSAALSDENKDIVKEWAEKYTMPKVAEKLERLYVDLIGRKKETLQLTENGWQSWSTSRRKYLRFPMWNYPPSKDRTLVHKDSYDRKDLKPRVTGWCSWYAYGSNISHNLIVKQAEFISKNIETYPLEYLLIDDGWTLWGDWNECDKVKFPEGIKETTSRINEVGLKSGIWMAPFLIDHRSRLGMRHPDWIVEQYGRPVNGLKVARILDDFSPFVKYLLDLRNPEVIEYLHETINKFVKETKIELLKLDFLFAVYFHPKIKNPEASWILNQFLWRVKNENPDLHLMACGAPFAPSVGVVDSMRVGPDPFSPALWDIPVIGRIINSRKAKQATAKVTSMLWTQKYWNVDADVFACRPELNFTDRLLKFHGDMIQRNYENGGNLFLGDDLTNLSEKRYFRYVSRFFNKS